MRYLFRERSALRSAGQVLCSGTALGLATLPPIADAAMGPTPTPIVQETPADQSIGGQSGSPTDSTEPTAVGEDLAARGQNSALAKPADATIGTEASSDIVVTARRPGAEVKIDRIVYDIQIGNDGASLTTTDVLRRLPGVRVTASNGVSIRGGADVGFLIDGKLVRPNIALAVPASQIERVELVTNPSAAFDSDNEALINLILKNDAKFGWSGTASGKFDTLGGYKAGVDFAHGGEDWKLNAALSARALPERNKTSRTITYAVPAENYDSQLTQIDERSTFRQLSAQGKLEGQLSDTDRISLTVGTNYNRNPQNSDATERFFGDNGALVDRYVQRSSFDGFYPYASASYESAVKDKRRITASFNANAGQSREERRYNGSLDALMSDRLNFSFIEGKLELEETLHANTVINAGLVLSRNRVTDQLLLNGFSDDSETQQGDFRFTRLSYAAYVTLQSTFAGIDFKPGLRLEYFNQNLNDGFTKIPGFRRALRLLPSLHLSKKIAAKDTLSASYTARFEKPDATNLSPLLRYSSQFQAAQGNPFLMPTTKSQFEIAHTHEGSKLFLTQAIFYRSTRDDVNSYIFLGSNEVAITSYANLGLSTSYGYSLTTKHSTRNGLTVGFGVDLFHRRIVAPILLDTYDSIAYTGFSTNLNVEYSISKADSLNFTASYASKTFTIGQSIRPEVSSDFQYSHMFKNKMTITVNLIDVGIPQRLRTWFRSPGLSGTESEFRKSRLLRIGLAMPF